MEARDFRKRAREKLKGKWSDAIVLTLVFVAFTAIVEWLGSLGENARLLSIASMAGLFSMIVMPAIKYGLTYSYMKLKNGEKVHPFDFLNYGFSNFGRAWGVSWNIFLKLIWYFVAEVVAFCLIFFSTLYNVIASVVLYSSSVSSVDSKIGLIILTVIGVIAIIVIAILAAIKGLYYSLSTFIAIENPNMTTKQEVEKSKRGKYFYLTLTFIGWGFLAGIVGGISGGILSFIPVISNIAGSVGMLVLIPYIQISLLEFYDYYKLGSMPQQPVQPMNNSMPQQPVQPMNNSMPQQPAQPMNNNVQEQPIQAVYNDEQIVQENTENNDLNNDSNNNQ